MKKIIHIVWCDKFTNGYIKYMLQYQTDFEHFFIYVKNDNYKIIDGINIFKLDSRKQLLSAKVMKLLKESDKIIVSGVFGVQKILFFYPNCIIRKMYLHFWGGDFYYYRNIQLVSKDMMYKFFLHSIIKRCAGIVNLIYGEYEELSKIFPNNTENYVAIMPLDPDKKKEYIDYIGMGEGNNSIIIGNSATQENHQVEILEKLSHLRNENIKIFCPLSYGDKSYADSVIKKGKSIFGNKFIGLIDYMEYDKYIDFLANCNVGIFNNDRQQAMGNINTLIRMGKKLYLREGTSMYKDYIRNGIKIYNINDLKNITIQELFKFTKDDGIKNNYSMKKRDKVYENGWNQIFNI